MDKRNQYEEKALEAHQKYQGKIAIQSKMPLETKEDLSIAYTPGVAAPCSAIAENRMKAYDYTSKGNTVAVISDGSAVLGLGNIGGEASLPVMEGKAVLFKKFGNIDAVPVILDTQDPDEIVATVKHIANTYGGINLEDIAAPNCFEVEERLKKECDIPVLHDDQHGTAIVTLAGLINACKVTGRNLEDLKIVVNGTGAAGVAIIKLLQSVGVDYILTCDSKGIIYEGRDNMNPVKQKIAKMTNPKGTQGSLAEAISDTDVFIGVSVPDVISKEMIESMYDDPIIFAMANPIPEIMPEDAKDAGAAVIATGRSDFPNQINNVLAFPGLFRGALNARAKEFNMDMFRAAARAIADCVVHPTADEIIPSPFTEHVADRVAAAVEEVCKGQPELELM
jgi:malate dehydrogenase (oxaloacetate-decarboxylating)